MQPSSKRVLAVTVVLVLALIVSVLIRQPAVPDQDQIAAQLESARTAAEAHSTSGVMNVVSADFKGPDPLSNVDSLHFYLGHVLGQSGQAQIAFSPPSVVVQGDTATSTCQMTVRSKEGSVLYDKPLTLTWKREDGRRFLVLPTKVWRIIGAQYDGGLPGDE